LALFAGAGGGLLGTRLLGWRTVCAVEISAFRREVILRRQEEGMFPPPFPIWDDVKTFDGRPWRGKVDVVTGGFPCQPFSAAGKRQGALDKRNLWPETIRVIREVRPRFCLLENVPGLLTSGYFPAILKDIAESGYDCKWKVISAREVGAPHRRDRLWVVMADAEKGGRAIVQRASRGEGFPEQRSQISDNHGERCQGEPLRLQSGKSRLEDPKTDRRNTWWEEDPAGDWNADGNGEVPVGELFEWAGVKPARNCQVRHAEGNKKRAGLCEGNTASGRRRRLGDSSCKKGTKRRVEPGLGRVAYGVANFVDRLEAIGDGQVPEVVRTAWNHLIK